MTHTPTSPSKAAPAIVWFRYDLRLGDHPALMAAIETGQPVLCVYIYDTVAARPLGGASRWWLHHSLSALQHDLKSVGANLHVMSGDPTIVLPSLVQEIGAQYVSWNRRYDLDGIAKDTDIKTLLADEGVDVHSFKGNLLREPWEMKTGSGNWYKVFTPYWKACLRSDPPLPPHEAPKTIQAYKGKLTIQAIDRLELLPQTPDWSSGFDTRWTPGSAGADSKLMRFLNTSVEDYANQRNNPSVYGTSRLSPHLAFGEISPREIWHKTTQSGRSADVFLSEVGWREFSYVLLYYNPKLASKNYKPDFDKFQWADNADTVTAWQKGMTGYPLVDAGMRELWATGWQHNRVRMVTASFLIKHLLQNWTQGERWFWDTLVDADPASNAASWQWTAGSGADASPYFRIFNPFTQGQKFDSEGDYVRRWVPELKDMPKKYIHTPWEAPAHVLAQAGVTLGVDYPKPIVEHKAARARALAAYKASREPHDLQQAVEDMGVR